ncbi:MAG: hypothetical protein HQ572_02185 [Candidatus Omnitrophica bacterium]|nr:hypothetical protein [Candidatus Omnitrophota bacterium]
MYRSRLKIIFVLLLILFIAVSVLYINIKKEQFISVFRNKLSEAFSNAIGAEVTIKGISSNIFTKTILRDLNCKFDGYEINFNIARLQYPLFDILTGRRRADEEADTIITLGRGSLRLDNNLIIKDIKGKIKLTKDELLVESLDFDLLDFFSSHIEGRALREEENFRIDFVSDIRPLFDKGNSLFDRVRIGLKGRADNMSISAELKGLKERTILLNGYLLSSAPGILNLGSEISVYDKDKRNIETEILMDTEIRLKESASSSVIILKDGSITIDADYSTLPILKADIKTNHVKIWGLDFSNILHLYSKLIFKDGEFSHLTADISTDSTILNYHPIDEIESSLWIDEDVARLIYLKVGDTISASGVISRALGNKTFLKAAITDLNIIDFHLIAGGSEETAIASGKLSGKVIVEGPLKDLSTKAGLEARDGHAGDIRYEAVILNIKGNGPQMQLYDSRIVREDSHLNIEGPFDMRKMGTEQFLEEIVISADDKTIIWEGWDITKAEGSSEVSLSRALGKGVRVGFKTYLDRDETAYEPVRPQSELGLEYEIEDEEGLLNKGTLEFKAKEREEFFGVKKRYKF